jgi:hypothetical protein
VLVLLPLKQSGGKSEVQHCASAPQPNILVKPTPTSSACWYPPHFVLRCGLPRALGKMNAPRTIALLLLPAALAVVVLGLFCLANAAPPYPDPTPEQLTEQNSYIQNGTWLTLGGAIAMLADGIWLWRTRNRA